MKKREKIIAISKLNKILEKNSIVSSYKWHDSLRWWALNLSIQLDDGSCSVIEFRFEFDNKTLLGKVESLNGYFKNLNCNIYKNNINQILSGLLTNNITIKRDIFVVDEEFENKFRGRERHITLDYR